MTTPLYFASVGFGNAVCANRIIAVLTPTAAAARRRLKAAKQEDRFLDLTFGRSQKCLLVLDDSTLVGCGLTSRTILARLAQQDTASDDADEIQKEDD